jgi:hypothetical protein
MLDFQLKKTDVVKSIIMQIKKELLDEKDKALRKILRKILAG